MEAAKAALDTRVQEAVQEAARKLQEDQRMGAQRIIDWASEASSALVPLGMSPIQVAEPPASIADALPVLDSASERLMRLDQILIGHLKAEGRELCRMVAEYILTCLQSHDPAISLAPVILQVRRSRICRLPLEISSNKVDDLLHALPSGGFRLRHWTIDDGG